MIFEQNDPFIYDNEGYAAFRIPSLIVTARGTVLASCEGRRDGSGDTGEINTVLKRSFDGGRTWTPMQIVATDPPHTFGNPCPVIDRDTGTIWMLLTWNRGDDIEHEMINGTSKDIRHVFVTKSTDDGETWTEPVEITQTASKPDWAWYATGPGCGIQLASGRMLIPCDNGIVKTRDAHSLAIYSDDHGETWLLGGVVPDNQTNECQAVELADGSVMMNMRHHHSERTNRGVAISRDEGMTWKVLPDDETLVEPRCQASILRFTLEGPHDRNRLLFSNPASNEERTRMTVRVSYDEGKTWPVAKLVNAGPSAYSALGVLHDMTIGCLYECNKDDEPRDRVITFARFDLDWITDGADKLAMK